MNTDLLRHAVATASTVYGIETAIEVAKSLPETTLQQHLPFTVLKLKTDPTTLQAIVELQQHLPFTVLKR